MWSLVLAVVALPAVASPLELDVGRPVAPLGGFDVPFAPPTRRLADVPPQGVVNGTNATAGEYEEVVVLVVVSYGAPFCSGTLIAPDWVLTAAHCIAGFEPAYESGDIAVVVDANLAAPDDPPNLSGVFTSEGIVHPDYSGLSDAVHDVGLVHLADPITSIQPAVLNDEPYSAGDLGEELTFVGYGAIDGTSQFGSGRRRYADMPLVDVDGLVLWIFDDSDPHQNLCNGDSGGAAFEWTPAGRELAGVNSVVFATQVGDDPCNDGGTGAARVDIHVPWILGFAPDVLLEPPGGPLDTGTTSGTGDTDTGIDGNAMVEAPDWGEPHRPSEGQYPGGCGCGVGTSPAPAGTPWLLVLAWLTRRRRRP